MRAVAKLKDMKTDSCKLIIIRNLSRILDIRILDIDPESRTLSFLCADRTAFEKAQKELQRLGFPIIQCSIQKPIQKPRRIQRLESTI